MIIAGNAWLIFFLFGMHAIVYAERFYLTRCSFVSLSDFMITDANFPLGIQETNAGICNM